jgi:hypothetical protein
MLDGEGWEGGRYACIFFKCIVTIFHSLQGSEFVAQSVASLTADQKVWGSIRTRVKAK